MHQTKDEVRFRGADDDPRLGDCILMVATKRSTYSPNPAVVTVDS